MAIKGINPARFLIAFAKEKNVIPRIWLTFLWKLMHDFARPKRKIFKNCKFLVFNNVQFFRAPLNFLYIQDRFLL